MPGMDIPQPGGAMKKLSLEFADAQDAAAQQGQAQIPPGAGVPPAGMQAGALPPAGMQAPAPQVPAAPEGAAPGGMPQEAPGNFFGALAGGADQFGQGPDSSMFTDDQLASMVDSDPSLMDPMELEGQQMHEALMAPDGLPPGMAEQMQMQLMEAARRRGGF